MSLWTKIEQLYGISIKKSKKIRDVYMLYTKQHGVLCLKSYDIPNEEMSYIAQIFKHLEDHGFEFGPKMLLTHNQSPWFTIDGMQYMLTNWVLGNQPDFKNKLQYKDAVQRLAGFHTTAQGLADTPGTEARTKYHRLPKTIGNYREALSKLSSAAPLLALCDESIELLKDTKALKAIEQEREVNAFTHGDYNYPNVVRDPSGLIHMIDFENSALNVRLQDFAHILYRNFPWQSKEMMRWIEYYHSQRPLTAEDRFLLHALLLVPYPVVRELRLKKSKAYVKKNLPTQSQIREYKDGLRELL